jgi:hypothetical protein
MRLDCLAAVVDPAVRPRFLDHRRKIPLPSVVAFDIWPVAQRSFQDPGGLGIRQFGGTGHRLADRIEIAAVARSDELEGAKVVAVFEREFA